MLNEQIFPGKKGEEQKGKKHFKGRKKIILKNAYMRTIMQVLMTELKAEGARKEVCYRCKKFCVVRT